MRVSSLRPNYLTRRLSQIAFQKRSPDCPWLSPAAILLLSEWLKPTDHGIEYGSGRSTIWIANRTGYLVSVEDNLSWHQRVHKQLKEAGLAGKVDYRYVECKLREQDEPDVHPYADVAEEFSNESLDFALVDGNLRLLCMRKVIRKIKPGGLLILDNANRYVPNVFLNGNTTIHEPCAKPRTPGWERLLFELNNWRWINTSDGIWDTRFWVKPCS